MTTNYTEEEIKWALDELKEKHPERATREQAIKLLDMTHNFASVITDTIKTDKETGKLKKVTRYVN